jgi:hypothetical protein
MTSLHEPPLFAALKGSERILVAGAGGGFDVYAGLPLALALMGLGKTVHLALARLPGPGLHGLRLSADRRTPTEDRVRGAGTTAGH